MDIIKEYFIKIYLQKNINTINQFDPIYCVFFSFYTIYQYR